MKLVVGLGNPGDAYSRTRHNLGFLTVEKIAAALTSGERWQEKRGKPPYAVFPIGKGAAGDFWMLFKSLTFMNESGRAVAAFLKYSGTAPGDLWLVHDDVDLPEGELREVFGSGSAGHRGVESVIESLGTNVFHRLRIGVGRPENPHVPTDDFVLEKVSPERLEPLVARAAEYLRRKMDLHG
jgi:PTH1 family peptidyl-tRNA hydrolase